MKKVVSILTALVLLFSLVVIPASAEKSPAGTSTYKVTVDYDIDIEENLVYNYIQDGDTYTLTANTKDKNNSYMFIRWAITGNYEIISGSLTSPTLVIKPLGDVTITQVVEKYEDLDKKPDKNLIKNLIKNHRVKKTMMKHLRQPAMV